MSKILIGWAEESLVPEKKVSLSGQFFERISESVESEICATAMAVETKEDQMIIVSVDMEGFPESLVQLAREKFRELTNEIISVYEEITELKEEAVFEHKIINLDLPLRRVTMSDYNNAVREIEYYIEKNKDKESFTFEDSARLHVHIGTITRFRRQQTTNVVTPEIHIIRFGDISISTSPFELFLDYGNIIKARALSEQAFIIQLCCGGMGYLPTEKAEKGGHYSAYVSSGVVGHEGGDVLVRKTIEEINKMF